MTCSRVGHCPQCGQTAGWRETEEPDCQGPWITGQNPKSYKELTKVSRWTLVWWDVCFRGTPNRGGEQMDSPVRRPQVRKDEHLGIPSWEYQCRSAVMDTLKAE